MLLQTLFSVSLLTNVSLSTATPPDSDPAAWTQMTVRQKEGALLPLIHSATDCILRSVSKDPRYGDGLRPGEINDLIVDSIASCTGPLRAMIDAHDRMYGSGSGEAFFMGPYLEVLPATISKQVRARAP